MLFALATLAILLSAPETPCGFSQAELRARAFTPPPQNESRTFQNEAPTSRIEAASPKTEPATSQAQAVPVQPASDTAEQDSDRPAPVLLSLAGSAGTRGEGALELVLHWQGEQLAFGLGAEGITGPQTPARQGVISQFEFSFAPATLHMEVRARPPQSGAERISGEFGLRIEGASGSADLTANAVSAQASGAGLNSGPLRGAEIEFTSAGAAVEGEAAISKLLWLGAHLAASADRLVWRGRPSAHPWDALGTAVLEWPDQWDATTSLRAQSGDATVALSAGAAEPASPGVFAARAALRIEVAAGPASLALSLGGARQWPSGLWLADVAFGAALKLGQVDKE